MLRKHLHKLSLSFFPLFLFIGISISGIAQERSLDEIDSLIEENAIDEAEKEIEKLLLIANIDADFQAGLYQKWSNIGILSGDLEFAKEKLDMARKAIVSDQPDNDLFIDIVSTKAKISIREKKFDEAKAFLLANYDKIESKAIGVESISDFYLQLSDVYGRFKNVDSTKLFSEMGLKAIAGIKDNRKKMLKEVQLKTSLANAYNRVKDKKNAILAYIELADLAVELNDTFLINKHNTSAAFQYFYSGEFGKCAHHVKKGMKVNLEKYGPDSPEILRNYQNLAVVYTKLENYEEANVYYEKAYGIIKEFKGEESLAIARLNFNIGVGEFQKQNFEEAIVRFKKSLAVREKLLEPNHSDLAHTNQIIGTSLTNLYKQKESMPYMLKAFEIRQKIGDSNSPDAIRLYTNLALNMIEFNKLDKAQEYLDLAYAGLGYDTSDPLNFDKIQAPFMISNPLEVDIEIGREKYRTNPTEEVYKEVKKKLNICDSIINYVKYSLDDPGSRMMVFRKQKLLYDEVIFTHALHHENTNSPEDIAEVFRVIEKGNNGMMYEKLAESQSESLMGMPSSLIDKKYSIEDSIYYYENLLSSAEENKKTYILDKITFHKDRFYALLQNMKEKHPKYFNAVYEYPLVSLEDYQNVLLPNEKSISYILGNRKSYAVSVSQDVTQLIELGISEEVNKEVTKFLEALKDRKDYESFKASARAIYDILIKPLDLQGQESLTLITDEIFSLIPFGVLMSDSESFLFEDHVVSYQYSATMRSQMNKNKISNSPILAMAPVFEEKEMETPLFAQVLSEDVFRDELGPLLESEKELSNIKELINGEYYLKSEATEETFKNKAKEAKIIHLATHGFVNHENADNSRLYFFQDSSSQEDGILNSYEIMNMDLHAELVTLSACNTGVGKIQSGEGVASLGRSFAYAGCKNQLISLWPANDRSTTSIMKNYYTNLKLGQGKATSLKNAKIEYLATAPEVFKHPYYWAGFIYYGNDETIDLSKSGIPWMYTFGFIFFSLLAWTLFKKKAL